MKGILDGIRIIEGSAFVAAPLGGMTLAQLGAEVIRFDPVGGGLDYRRWPVTSAGDSLFWAGMNKGKKSFQVDLSRPEGRQLISGLICQQGENNGIFLTNFPERGWLSYDELRKNREDLIYVNIMGDRKGGSALDYTVNCAVGFTNATGDPEDESPTNYLLPAWDNITGQMAAVALLAAERHRRLNGDGQLVKLALKDVALATTGHLGNIAEVSINETDREKVGNYLYGGFGRDFLTKDDKRLMIVGLTSRQWLGIKQATATEAEMESLALSLAYNLDREGDRFLCREKIAAILEPWFRQRTFAEVVTKLDQCAVCWGPYRSFREMLEMDEDCSLNNPIFSLKEQPGIGTYLMPGSPIRFQSSENLEASRAPQLGEHTDEILADILGMSDQQIRNLYDDKIVAGIRA